MISLEQFIIGIQNAIQSANNTLQEENVRFIETYFEDSEEAQEIKTSLDRAMDAMQEVVTDENQNRETVERAMKAFAAAREAFQNENRQGETDRQSTSFRAKTVALQFPEQTPGGTTMRNVHVPLISLIPISMAQIAEVKFRANLELLVKDELLYLGFLPSTKGADNLAQDNNTDAGSYIEITVKPTDSPEGLKKLIKGYDNMLRGQIPN